MYNQILCVHLGLLLDRYMQTFNALCYAVKYLYTDVYMLVEILFDSFLHLHSLGTCVLIEKYSSHAYCMYYETRLCRTTCRVVDNSHDSNVIGRHFHRDILVDWEIRFDAEL